mmetsp:Transcript_36177/g.95129  ORF Transcript_36177/g.95129 Transcript_36177/m.95129 type:complete len:142 (-) Transcript_36177:124-549(-)
MAGARLGPRRDGLEDGLARAQVAERPRRGALHLGVVGGSQQLHALPAPASLLRYSVRGDEDAGVVQGLMPAGAGPATGAANSKRLATGSNEECGSVRSWWACQGRGVRRQAQDWAGACMGGGGGSNQRRRRHMPVRRRRRV